jgi:hypothetical protein
MTAPNRNGTPEPRIPRADEHSDSLPRPLSASSRAWRRVGFANSGGLVFVDEPAEEVVAP